MGEGWGGGEKPQLIELLHKNHEFGDAEQSFLINRLFALRVFEIVFKSLGVFFTLHNNIVHNFRHFSSL